MIDHVDELLNVDKPKDHRETTEFIKRERAEPLGQIWDEPKYRLLDFIHSMNFLFEFLATTVVQIDLVEILNHIHVKILQEKHSALEEAVFWRRHVLFVDTKGLSPGPTQLLSS